MNNNLHDIKKIFEEDKNEIIAGYKGVGAGIGKRGQDYVIVIYTNEPQPSVASTASWKGIPLVMENTGKIIPYRSTR